MAREGHEVGISGMSADPSVSDAVEATLEVNWAKMWEMTRLTIGLKLG